MRWLCGYWEGLGWEGCCGGCDHVTIKTYLLWTPLLSCKMHLTVIPEALKYVREVFFFLNLMLYDLEVTEVWRLCNSSSCTKWSSPVISLCNILKWKWDWNWEEGCIHKQRDGWLNSIFSINAIIFWCILGHLQKIKVAFSSSNADLDTCHSRQLDRSCVWASW